MRSDIILFLYKKNEKVYTILLIETNFNNCLFLIVDIASFAMFTIIQTATKLIAKNNQFKELFQISFLFLNKKHLGVL